jgi:hypothetical protein
MFIPLVVLALLGSHVSNVDAIGQATCVSFIANSSTSSFQVVTSGKAAPILLSADEWPGVQRAAADFATDIQRVTNVKPSMSNVTATSKIPANPIIIGTLGKSSLIDQVINNTNLDVSSISGQWEAFLSKEVSNPLPGVDKAYVVIGADKRGTIFALYDHSEQFGRPYDLLFPSYSAHITRQVSRLGTGSYLSLAR